MFSTLIGAIIAGGFGYVAFQMGSFSLSTSYSKSWLMNQLNPLRQELNKLGLTPLALPPKEWNLLSAHIEPQQKSRSLFTQIKLGILTSIFSENLVLFATKGQPFSFGKTITLARVDDIEIAYINNNKVVTVFINNQPHGEIKDLSIKTVQGISVNIVDTFDTETVSLRVNNQEIARLIRKSEIGIPLSTRAITLLDERQLDAFVRAMPLLIYYVITELND